MRRSVLTWLAFVVIAMEAPAAVSAEGRTGFGFKGGLNIATLNSSEAAFDNFKKNRLGIIGGLFFRYIFNKHFALQPEMLISVKGAKFQVAFSDEVARETDTIVYLEIPLLARYDLLVEGPITPFFLAGPACSINLAARYEYEDGDIYDKGDLDGVKGSDLAMVLGSGLDLQSGAHKISLEARYTLGLTDIDSSDYWEKVWNRVFSLMIGYSF